MELGQALLAAAIAPDTGIEVFARELDLEWVRRVLDSTQAASIRRRKLPAEYVVWLVVGMGLFRDHSIEGVVRHLNLVLPDTDKAGGRGRVTGSAIVQARSRLGAEPLALLFADTANRWATASADKHRWRGLAVYGVDGSTLRIPDTEENEGTFGRPGSSRGRAAYPQVRVVALMVLRSHLLAAAQFGASSDSEVKLAEKIWPTLPENSITIVDRGFVSYKVFHQIHSGDNRHWLTRSKNNLTLPVIKRLGKGDHLVEIPLNRNLRRANPHLPETLPARAIRYQRRGFRPQALLTSLLDAHKYPAAEIIDLYHERWEIEIALDEIKTHTLDREEALRSRSPERVRQELWGLALGYNLLRLEMERAATLARLPPCRISYKASLLVIRSFWLTAWQLASPGNLPRHLETLHQDLAFLVLPERRERRYPRAVKIKMSNYPLKRDGLK